MQEHTSSSLFTITTYPRKTVWDWASTMCYCVIGFWPFQELPLSLDFQDSGFQIFKGCYIERGRKNEKINTRNWLLITLFGHKVLARYHLPEFYLSI